MMAPSQFLSRYSSLDPPHYEEGGVIEPTITLRDASISYHLIPDAEDAEDIVDPALAPQNWFLFHRKVGSQSDCGDAPSRQQCWETRTLPAYHEDMTWNSISHQPLPDSREVTDPDRANARQDQSKIATPSERSSTHSIPKVPRTALLQRQSLLDFCEIMQEWDCVDTMDPGTKSLLDGNVRPTEQSSCRRESNICLEHTRSENLDYNVGSIDRVHHHGEDRLSKVASGSEHLPSNLNHPIASFNEVGEPEELEFVMMNRPMEFDPLSRSSLLAANVSEVTISRASIGARDPNQVRMVLVNSRSNPRAEESETISTQSFNSPSLPQFSSVSSDPVASEEVDVDITRILRLSAFESFLESNEGRMIFRSWLESNQNLSATDGSRSKTNRVGLAKLDRWTDELKTEALLKKLRDQSKLVHDLYYVERPEVQLDLLPDQADQRSRSDLLKMANSVKTGLSSSRSGLLRSMFEDEFRRFITSKLIKLTTSRLKGEVSGNMGALAEAFVLTNPRVRDNPIVMVSPGFTSLTGYTLEELVGKNCRMLSGARTSASTRQRIKNNIESLRPSIELVLNYRKDGSPFYCLVHITPLFDIQGDVTYFFGGHVDVTAELQSSNLIDFSYKIDKNKHTSNKRSNKAIRSIVSDSPLMQKFKAGESLTHKFKLTQESIGRQRGVNQFGALNVQVLDKANEPMNPKRMTIAWISSLNRKRKNTSESRKAPEPPSLRGGSAAGNSSEITSPTGPQVSLLEGTYARVVVFKRACLEIIFATPGALMLLGLPARTERDVNMSPLLQSKITDHLHGATPKLTKNLRRGVIEAVKRGGAVSCSCVLFHGSNIGTSDEASVTSAPGNLRFSMLHLTPLMDRKRGVSAYVGIMAG